MAGGEDIEFFVIPKQSTTKSRDDQEQELENAITAGYSVIVIEPRVLGDEVIRWIRFGNFLHKTAVLASFISIIQLPWLSRRTANLVPLPLGLVGVSCALFYNISWHGDPCSYYQVDYKGKRLQSIPSDSLTSQSPVVIYRVNPKARLVLHTSLAAVVCVYLGWRLGEKLLS